MAPFRLNVPVEPDILMTWQAAVLPPVPPDVSIPPLALTVPVVTTMVEIREELVEVLAKTISPVDVKVPALTLSAEVVEAEVGCPIDTLPTETVTPEEPSVRDCAEPEAVNDNALVTVKLVF